ncbi:hypothetical protein GF386_01275 [Candidatus Pacearchaeota archaeon]|nr:hypothetical protein [Candidatus Pacearchaeota archaeon]MBD3282839.1 hypothetical protein [Candidatus Pacearchaeota archaeon]
MDEERKIHDNELKKDETKDNDVNKTVTEYSESKDKNKEDEIKKSGPETQVKPKNIADDKIQERKEKFLKLLKTKQIWVVGVLIIAIILGVYIRSLPMQDHNPNVDGLQPGLWDITTNTWTLGPDLDPWLFTRYAKTIVEEGSLPEKDNMRNVPLGFNIARETKLLPYMIAWTYQAIKIFNKDANVELAAVTFPVIMFALTIISFFLFVREVFIKKDKKSIVRANLIASISTFFMIVVPSFLSRTIAGIPEKESAAFFFMFLSFYFYLKAWKHDEIKKYLVFSVLAGISTALMGHIWGGFIYVYVIIAFATLLNFLIGKNSGKEIIIYSSWLVISSIILTTFSEKYTLIHFLGSISTAISFFVFSLLIIDYILWNSPISKKNLFKNLKIPKEIISLIIAIILGALAASLFFGPGFIYEKITEFMSTLFNPTYGRFKITVAENRQPYFREWGNSFGPFIKNFPVMFWLFFLGSVFLFKEMLSKLKKRDAWILTGFYVLFFFGLVFSRYSSDSVFNGNNFISKALYIGTSLILILSLIYYYYKYYREGYDNFQKINSNLLFLFALFAVSLVTVRAAVRLVMVLAAIVPIFQASLIVVSIEKFKESKEDFWRIIWGAFAALVIILSLFVFVSYYNTVKTQAYNFIPSHYNQQWQKAMDWVREETPKDAVFAHWWDYGYWLQSIGNRATVLDGGNAIAYWNYLMGRLVLTGDNQKDSLEFLYNHNATHLLIDSTDIGKYGAFSSIGSDENYDRYSWIGTFLLDEKQTTETNNQTIFAYKGGIALDGDMIIEKDGKEILLPKQKSAVLGFIVPFSGKEDSSNMKQPSAIMFYNGVQHKVDLRYIAVGDNFLDFGSGIEACLYIIPKLDQQGNSVSANPMGAAIFLSPKLLKGYLAQKYILDDPFNNFENFELVHTQQSLVIKNLESQGMDLPDLVHFRGIQGPIKIWEIKYTGDEEKRQEYLDTDYSKYLDWRL